jgi:hypothetical protein
MKNSLIYKLDSKNDFNNIKRLATFLSKYTSSDVEKTKIGVVPIPRDGHTANIYEGHMILFGGDRNKFPFNDLYLFKLK